MQFHKLFFVCLLPVILITYPPFALSWGERGHDLITRVAVQQLRDISADDSAVVSPFRLRDHMLSHMSNVPDIVWRAPYQSETARSLNYPTHYINLEKVYTGVGRHPDIPSEFSQFKKDAAAKGLKPSEVGTAPWRALSLYQSLVEALSKVHQLDDEKAFESQVNEALLLAGVLSHFVGDLANPHHTTANYDGQLTGQHGLHAYFESEVVADLDLKLVSQIHRSAKRDWLKVYPRSERLAIKASAQKLIWALVADSHSDLPTLLSLDKRHSLLVAGNDEARAQRKPVADVSGKYRRFAIKRMAIGANALAQLWYLAWQEAGEPDLSPFFSYAYPVQPAFIVPPYQD